MAFQRLRRATLSAVCACAALLASCGGGEVVSKFTPTRLVAFGDGMADLGQTGSLYTINDGSVAPIWTQVVAAHYVLALATARAGGLSFATGNARVIAKPDAAGNAQTPTISQQIESYLASQAFGDGDLVIVNAGTADVVAEAAAAFDGRQPKDQALAHIRQAGRDLGSQLRRLVQAGAKHVVVAGPYNLGRSPWGLSSGQADSITDWANRFNEEMLASVVDLGANVLYVDQAFYYNLVTGTPGSYGFDDATSVACTSVDPGPGVGIGAGKVNSRLCTASTLSGSINPARTFFADPIYPTPPAQRLFGDYAFDRVRSRW